jgi:hypothetical protein
MSSLSFSALEKGSYEYASEKKTLFVDSIIKYCDPVSAKVGDWVQSQGRKKQPYHEYCVSAEGKKTFIGGRCANMKCSRVCNK